MSLRYLTFLILLGLSVPGTFAYPIIGVVLYTALNLIRPEMLFWGGEMGNKALYFVMLVLLLATVLGGRLDFRKMTAWPLVVALWIFGALHLSMALSEFNPPLASDYALEILKTAIFCYMLHLYVETPRQLFNYSNVLVYATSFFAVWGVDQYMRGNYRLEGLGGDTLVDSNYIAAHCVLFLPLALTKMFDSPVKRDRLIGAACSLAMFFCVLSTMSRGGLLGLVIAVTLYALRSRHKKKLAGFALVAALAAAPFLTDAFKERMSTLQGGVETMDDSGLSRMALWRAGWYVFLDRPIVGAGFMAFPRAKVDFAHKFDDLSDQQLESWIYPAKVTHSFIFQVLSEGGLMLFIPYLIFYLGTQYWNRQALKRAPPDRPGEPPLRGMLIGFQAGLAGWLTCVIFLDAIGSFFPVLVINLGYICRRRLRERRVEREGEDEDAAPEALPESTAPAPAAVAAVGHR